MNDRGGDVLAVVERVPIAWLPERYRRPMREFLGQGILPDSLLRLLLEGNVATIRAFANDLPEVAALVTWVEACLPPQCWGSTDQVQLWIVYVRRARGRAMLASFGGE